MLMVWSNRRTNAAEPRTRPAEAFAVGEVTLLAHFRQGRSQRADVANPLSNYMAPFVDKHSAAGIPYRRRNGVEDKVCGRESSVSASSRNVWECPCQCSILIGTRVPARNRGTPSKPAARGWFSGRWARQSRPCLASSGLLADPRAIRPPSGWRMAAAERIRPNRPSTWPSQFYQAAFGPEATPVGSVRLPADAGSERPPQSRRSPRPGRKHRRAKSTASIAPPQPSLPKSDSKPSPTVPSPLASGSSAGGYKPPAHSSGTPAPLPAARFVVSLRARPRGPNLGRHGGFGPVSLRPEHR